MKILLLVGLLGGSFISWGQMLPTHAKPQTHDNFILLQTHDSTTTALKKLAQIFVSRGYKVEKLDKQFLALSCAPIFFARHNNATILLARATATAGSNSLLQLQINFQANPLPNSSLLITQGDAGLDKETSRSAFRTIEKAALAYSGGVVSYGRQ